MQAHVLGSHALLCSECKSPCSSHTYPPRPTLRPDEAFVTERAQRSGRANAASGRIMVTVPNDHFGPILAEHDPENGKVRCAAIWTCDLVIWQVHA